MSGTSGALPRRFLILVLTFGVCLAASLVVAGMVRADQMVASWYGPGFEGATTASGEPFDPNGYTAAHRTLPFGTKLIVTYNGRSVVVRINDRGPYVAGRDIDLSQGAAQYLGLTSVGEATVSVETASPSTPEGPYSGSAAPQPAPQQPAPAPQQPAPQETPQAVGQTGGQQPVAAPAASASEVQYANGSAARDQYEDGSAARDQYAGAAGQQAAQPEAAPPPPAEPAPVAPPPVPDPSRVETPPADLATPGSTVERRVVIFLGPEPAKETQEQPAPQEAAPVETAAAATPKVEGPEAKAPVAEAPAEEKPVKKVAGLTMLPDTGGAPLGAPFAGILLVGAGAMVLRRR